MHINQNANSLPIFKHQSVAVIWKQASVRSGIWHLNHLPADICRQKGQGICRISLFQVWLYWCLLTNWKLPFYYFADLCVRNMFSPHVWFLEYKSTEPNMLMEFPHWGYLQGSILNVFLICSSACQTLLLIEPMLYNSEHSTVCNKHRWENADCLCHLQPSYVLSVSPNNR